jgi:valyl-tRNA synthetase
VSDLESKTRYEPSEVEPRIIQQWLDSGLGHPDPGGTAESNYSIAIPPPNVTGVLHMGHALNNSIQDALIRHARASGKRAKWILGTDHAGIATQTQVEKALKAEGESREEIGREAFVERVWEWRGKYGGEIVEQLKRLGVTPDFEDERFTLDDGYVKAVQKVFVDLFNKGYIYRDRYLVNWDPGSRSDTLFYIDYPLQSGEGHLTVATVRPETMLADVAVAVNPSDPRYQHLIGQHAVLPLVGRALPIIADDYVKTEFGTGALKITPAHDPNDFEIGHRHGLESPSVIGEDGRLTDEAPERFRGLSVAEAQAAIVAELEAGGSLSSKEPYTHTVPFSQRSGERIEPLISLQWFMRMDELAAPAIEVVKQGKLHIHPDSQSRRYVDWLENIRPWCISRQLWWGHQIPVWYRGEQTHVGAAPPEGEGWERDPDVLDTWFSSALWPFATLGWPEQTPELTAFYPTDALVTSRDIVFLWVARMVMMGLEFLGEVPFSDVYVHAIVQAPDGRRMSKSLGTGVDPLELIKGGPRPPVFNPGGDPGSFPAYGADAVRWGLLAMSSSQDVKFSEERVAQGQSLANKLWNASRLILLKVDPSTRAAAMPATVEDRWILSRLARAQSEVATRIEQFDFARAANEIYDFVYAELCDWYLELVKPRLYEGDPQAAATLLHLLTETVQLAHPVTPFVTEEIYAHIPGSEGLLAQRTTPAAADALDPAAEAALEQAITAVTAIRAWRDSTEVKPSALLPARLIGQGYAETAAQVALLARLDLDSEAANGGEPAATVPIPGGSLEVLPSADLDLEAAGRKEEAKRAELTAEIARAKAKLANEGFVAKARPDVVQAERRKLAALETELAAL